GGRASARRPVVGASLRAIRTSRLRGELGWPKDFLRISCVLSCRHPEAAPSAQFSPERITGWQRAVLLDYRFGEFEIDLGRHELRRGGQAVRIEPQVFDLLVHLIRHRDRIVSKDELIEAVWQGRIISEAALSSCVSAARRAIDDSGNDQRL